MAKILEIETKKKNFFPTLFQNPHLAEKPIKFIIIPLILFSI